MKLLADILETVAGRMGYFVAFLAITVKKKIPGGVSVVPLLTLAHKHALPGLVIRKKNRGVTYLQLNLLNLGPPFYEPNSLLLLSTSLCAHRFHLCRKCKIECLCSDHMTSFHCAAARVLCQTSITMQLTETQTFFS